MPIANPPQDRGTTMFNNHCSRGELYEAASGLTALTLSVGILRGVLSNPANSGKNLIVTNVRIGNTISTAQSVTLRFNPTTVPANSVTPWNRLATNGSASQATFTYDTASSGLSGGTVGPTYGLYGTILTTVVDAYNPILLQPGVSVGLSTSAFGLTANAECIANWIEVSV
jgi:hypothetical protein